MNWEEYLELSKKWCEAREESAEIRKRFVKPEYEEIQAENVDFEQVEEIIDLLKKANAEGEVETFEKLFPPAHDLLASKLEQLEMAISNVVITEDETILFRKGNEKENGCLYYIKNNQIATIPDGEFAGISKDKQYIAISYRTGICLYTKDGKLLKIFRWPLEAEENTKIYQVKSITPFWRGERILLVTVGGIFVLSDNEGSQLIHPREQDLEYLDMVHGDVSPREKFIVVGDQDSEHIVVDVARGYEESEVVDTELSYADFALFNGDGSYVIMNSCQMYDGASVILGMDTDDIADVEIFARFSAGASCDKCFIVGDIRGNIYSINTDGTWNWTYYVGSTIKGIDISKDGKTLVVGTFAGMLHLLHLEYEENGVEVKNIEEVKRWIAWKGEDAVYEW